MIRLIPDSLPPRILRKIYRLGVGNHPNPVTLCAAAKPKQERTAKGISF